MGYAMKKQAANEWLNALKKDYVIYAPKLMQGMGTYSDTDRIRYEQVDSLDEIEFEKKAEFSFKEVLTPITETLFYFTESQVKEAEPRAKGAVVFLRSCDLHGVKRMDDIYLNNGEPDYYYKRIRDNVKFILMGCESSFENCFCVSMETNKSDDYDGYLKLDGDRVFLDMKDDVLAESIIKISKDECSVTPDFVEENDIQLTIPDNIRQTIFDSDIWEEYNVRCIGCGRCNFVCPTCTCYTMQDIFYSDNGRVGERRRVWASCQVDGFTDMAGGHAFRQDQGQRMRYKALHKVSDHKKRFGHHMCVGCGRCDDICPEYISFSKCIERLNKEVEEK